MICREIIANTQMLPLDASGEEIDRYSRLMNEIGDVITSEELQNSWRDAKEHLRIVKEHHQDYIDYMNEYQPAPDAMGTKL